MDSDSQRQSLPFEPGRAKPNQAKKDRPARPAKAQPAQPSAAQTAATKSAKRSRQQAEQIPEVVSRRMIRRMLVFSGIPTATGLATFVGAYFLLTRHILEFPKALVLVSTLVCFGVGFIGLSYGVLSSSWEEETDGSLLGVSEFSLNLGRMIQAWRESRQR
ncbi:MAG: DUF3464 family protein [Leptolyngbya sp. SIO4C1]|nr:DUF3464 family protein [Leptolyngbya sp. SIO4C1]